MNRGERFIIRFIYTYIDPGTSATMMQLVLAGTAGLAAAGKIFVGRFRRRKTSKGAVAPATTGPQTEDAAPSE